MQLAAITRIVLGVLLSCLWIGPAMAQEFRVETEVFVEDEQVPCVKTLTIFSDDIAYDFLLTGVQEITMIDRARKRIVLMDPDRKVKTELSTDGVLAFVAQMKTHLNGTQRKYLLGDELKQQTAEDGWITFSNDRVTYRVKGMEPKDLKVAVKYHQFADWSARLNAMRLGNLPPFARLRINAALAKKQLVPEKVQRTVVRKKTFGEVQDTLHSRHRVTARLSHTDRKLIDRASTYLATFPTVSFREYLELPDVSEHAQSGKP